MLLTWDKNSESFNRSFNTSHEMPSRFSTSLKAFWEQNLRPTRWGGGVTLSISAETSTRWAVRNFLRQMGRVSCLGYLTCVYNGREVPRSQV